MRRRVIDELTVIGVLLGLGGIASEPSRAEHLQSNTLSAFEQYVRYKEAQDSRELANGKRFLWIDALPPTRREQAYADLRRGQIITQRCEECAPADCAAIPGGLVHDWIGIVFIPGVSLSQVLSTLEDYDQDAEYYAPEVLKSKLLKRSGDSFQIFLRLKKVKVVTVVLDTEYDVQYVRLDETHAYSRSHSTRINEVENAGEPQERARPVGDDHGFLWRLYSYWRFFQADGGVYVQCNVVSLTRDVPTGLGWLIRPFIESVPQDSLRFTLKATRNALVTKFEQSQSLVSSRKEGQSN